MFGGVAPPHLGGDNPGQVGLHAEPVYYREAGSIAQHLGNAAIGLAVYSHQPGRFAW
jgi:hypothetical protein